MKKCTSCGTEADKGHTEFKCPNCGKGLIVRCSSCRTLGAKYRCSECEFEGP
ncbi:MAG: DUF1610 domain-containing protein [Candidatus Altiarchaeota archaeon]|nr:DUF1610 domain-containing protein [Candidatus Altiarchaeota archaeon]